MKAVLTILVILVIGSALAGREGTFGGGSGSIGSEDGNAGRVEAPRNNRGLFGRARCTVVAEAPVRDPHNGRIVGTVRYECARPGGDLELAVRLQQGGPGTAWTTLDSQLLGARGAATTKSRPLGERTRSAGGACVDGTYRTFVSGTVTFDGNSESIETSSKPVADPCPKTRAN